MIWPTTEALVQGQADELLDEQGGDIGATLLCLVMMGMGSRQNRARALGITLRTAAEIECEIDRTDRRMPA